MTGPKSDPVSSPFQSPLSQSPYSSRRLPASLDPLCLLSIQKTQPALRGDNCRHSAPSAAPPEPWHSGLSISNKNRVGIILKNALYSFTRIIAFNVPPHPGAEREGLHFPEEKPGIQSKVLLASLQGEWSQEHNPELLSASQPHHSFSKTVGGGGRAEAFSPCLHIWNAQLY